MKVNKSVWQREIRYALWNSDGVHIETGRRSPAGPALLIADVGVEAEDRMRPVVVTTLCE